MNRAARQRTIVLVLAVTGLSMGMPAAGWASSHGRPEQPAAHEAPHAVTRSGMSLDEAVQMVQQRFNARVVRAETRSDKGRTVHHLRLMNSEGKVWTVRVDAQSGAVR